MPKYIIPFVDKTQWQTSKGCPLCQAADIAYKKVMEQTNSFIQQKQIEELENVLVDGYNLLKVYEENGFAIYRKNDIEKIKTYTAVSDLFMEKVNHYFDPNYPLPYDINIDLPVLNHSRWCKYCGVRKPDIYNSTLVGDDELTNILDFQAILENNSASLSWTDITANNWHRSKIVRTVNNPPQSDNDGETIIEYTDINKFKTEPYIDSTIVAGNVYYYQVYSYDVLENVICSTQFIPILIEDSSYNPPDPIDEFDARQERYVEFMEDGTPVIRDYVRSRWPNNQKCDGVILRYNMDYDVPQTPWEGISTDVKTPVNLGYNDDANLLLGDIYCFRPFPYKDVHYVLTESGVEYINSKDYNYDSNSSYVRIQQHIDLPTDINVIGGDGNISVTWKDPDKTSWIATKILYKKGSMITSDWDPDAILAATFTNKNAFAEIPFVISNIENGEDYYVGIFPVNNFELCNVNIDNQKLVSTGYNKSDEIIDLNNSSDLPILNNWYVSDYDGEKVLHSPLLAMGQSDYVSFFETSLKYGAILTFKYMIVSHRQEGLQIFNVLLNGDKQSFDKRFAWYDAEVALPETDYLNIKFQFISGSNMSAEDYVVIKDIKIVFNKK